MMEKPIQLAYSTGQYISNTKIIGKIENYEKGSIVEIGLFNQRKISLIIGIIYWHFNVNKGPAKIQNDIKGFLDELK